MSKSQLEETLAIQIYASGLPEPEREYRFSREVVGNAPGVRERLRVAGLRDWRWDFAWLDQRVAVEVQGGAWQRGKKQSRHTRGGGYEGDCQKLCAGVVLGWRVAWVTGGMVKSGEAIRVIERLLGKSLVGP